MPSTHLSLHYHLVFSTKNREQWLSPTDRKRVHEYIGGILRNMDGIAHAVGGTGIISTLPPVCGRRIVSRM